MKDLRDAMLDAGAPRDDWNAEIPALIAAGQKRVRRRKVIAAGATAAVVAIVGTTAALAGLPGLNRADPDPVKPDKRTAIYTEERLAPTEVEDLCRLVVGQPKWVVGADAEGRAIAAKESARPVENRVGRKVIIAKPGSVAPELSGDGGLMAIGADTTAVCLIPQPGMARRVSHPAPNEWPAPNDSAGVEAGCSRMGYDFGGWTVLAATKSPEGVEAVLISDNGYAATCSLSYDSTIKIADRPSRDDRGEPIFAENDGGASDPKRYRDLSTPCYETERAIITCPAAGLIPGLPDGYRIETTLPDGTVKTARTSHGAFAFWFTVTTKELRTVEKDPDGMPLFPRRIFSDNDQLVWEGLR